MRPCSVSTEHPAFPRDNIGDIRFSTLIEKCFEDKFGIPTSHRRMRFRQKPQKTSFPDLYQRLCGSLVVRLKYHSSKKTLF